MLSQALNTQGVIASFNGRSEQSVALLKHSLEIALEHDLTAAAMRAYNNLGDQLDRRDRYEEAIEVHRRGLALARKAGERIQEWRFLGELAYCLMRAGQWAEAAALAAEVPPEQVMQAISVPNTLIELAVACGDPGAGERRCSCGCPTSKDSADIQDRSSYLVSCARSSSVRRGGSRRRWLLARRRSRHSSVFGGGVSADTKVALCEGLESALTLGRLETVEELLGRIDAIPPGKRPPSLRAHAARFRARLGAARGDGDGVEQGFKTAGAVFREHGLVFQLAVTQLEHGEWLAGQGRAAEAGPLLEEAGETFERLGAMPWIERVSLAGGVAAPAR